LLVGRLFGAFPDLVLVLAQVAACELVIFNSSPVRV
jgi:hypothetical protein